MRAVQFLYINVKAAVGTREVETYWFEVKCGVRPGCMMSPLSFIIFTDNIVKEQNRKRTILNGIKELMLTNDLISADIR